MDKELKSQLQTFIAKAAEKSKRENKNYNTNTNLDTSLKLEPTDSDDDCYYVLVINPEDGSSEGFTPSRVVPKVEPAVESEAEVDLEPEITPNINEDIPDPTESIQALSTTQDCNETLVLPPAIQNIASFQQEHTFNENLDYIVPDTRVPINVPATILESEEESQDNEDMPGANNMEIDFQGNAEEIRALSNFIPPQNIMEDSNTGDGMIDALVPVNMNLDTEEQIIKILNSRDGAIVLRSGDNVTYLNSQLNGDDDDDMSQEEVILCDGDDSSQIQIIKCDSSELVIGYTDDGHIATVYQQDDGTFICDCGQTFKDLSEYELHQHHSVNDDHDDGEADGDTDNHCTLCGKGFESPEILTGHLLLHSINGLLISCPFCDQVVRRNTLTQHIKYSHNKIKPQCCLCNKTFANPNNLKRHMVIHSGIKEFECDICFKRFHQKITMQTHRLTHVNPLACRLCDETFSSKPALEMHNESGLCSKSKVEKVKEELLKNVKQEVTSNLGKLIGYACSICQKMFSIESALEQHILVAHVIDPADLLCNECGEVLPTKKDMQTHIMNHKCMRGKNVKRFECTICGKGCASQAMVIMHERVHTNERPYPCQLCSLRFKTKTHLRTHQLTHTREKKFGCSICMKFFALKGNLVVHLRTHTGERPYVCTACDEAFVDSKYLKKHKLKKHALENVPWNQL